MADFRLEVFYTVAKRLSFTKAAAELFITQPAVTKHIRELEEEYKAKLFDRTGNRISLTAPGNLLLAYAEKVFELNRNVAFEINALNNHHTGILRIGASTTVAQYIIAPILAKFKTRFADAQLNLITGNTEQIENALLAHDVDVAIIEGHTRKSGISYHEFLKDELVLTCSSKHPLARQNSLKLEQLPSLKMVLREHGSGSLDVIAHALKNAGISMAELDVEIRLGNTESIKAYLQHSPCMAFLSVYAIADEVASGKLKVIDVAGLTIERNLYLIHPQGKTGGLAELFQRFALSNHNLK
ncbi:LysR substrate-binding domain-containing protein [Mucilaginibacter pedocola]|uniref:Transcriptional regulator n=1 Tax=Mucilaginibacter pedocola TaxID=1792845 RepID=A0A1S9PIV5_9SPHI|nr:LysR substrate-binding domain-containing protein [Mucilaginibacter pedocola]OOQ60508.1 transcriptional regulator [Mucilaginibacter pedocola]